MIVEGGSAPIIQAQPAVDVGNKRPRDGASFFSALPQHLRFKVVGGLDPVSHSNALKLPNKDLRAVLLDPTNSTLQRVLEAKLSAQPEQISSFLHTSLARTIVEECELLNFGADLPESFVQLKEKDEEALDEFRKVFSDNLSCLLDKREKPLTGALEYFLRVYAKKMGDLLKGPTVRRGEGVDHANPREAGLFRALIRRAQTIDFRLPLSTKDSEKLGAGGILLSNPLSELAAADFSNLAKILQEEGKQLTGVHLGRIKLDETVMSVAVSDMLQSLLPQLADFSFHGCGDGDVSTAGLLKNLLKTGARSGAPFLPKLARLAVDIGKDENPAELIKALTRHAPGLQHLTIKSLTTHHVHCLVAAMSTLPPGVTSLCLSDGEPAGSSCSFGPHGSLACADFWSTMRLQGDKLLKAVASIQHLTLESGYPRSGLNNWREATGRLRRPPIYTTEILSP